MRRWPLFALGFLAACGQQHQSLYTVVEGRPALYRYLAAPGGEPDRSCSLRVVEDLTRYVLNDADCDNAVDGVVLVSPFFRSAPAGRDELVTDAVAYDRWLLVANRQARGELEPALLAYSMKNAASTRKSPSSTKRTW